MGQESGTEGRKGQVKIGYFKTNTFQIRKRFKPHLQGRADCPPARTGEARPRRWTTGFSPEGAISIAYLKGIAFKTLSKGFLGIFGITEVLG